MKRNNLTFVMLALGLLTPFAIQAQCPAPAPTNLAIGYEANTEIEINWDGVPAAQSYQVEVYEALSGTLIDTDTVTDNTHIQENLVPGQEYRFDVSSSYCSQGPYGDSTAIHTRTTIIIVDIIFQMDCADTPTTVMEGIFTAGSSTSFPPLSSGDGCYQLFFNTLTSPSYEFEMAFSTDNGKDINVGNMSTNIPDLFLPEESPLDGFIYIPATKTGYYPLFRMKSKNKANTLSFDFDWSFDVDMSLVFCSDCTPTSNSQAFPTGELNQPQVQISPNPTTEIFNVSLPENGGTLVITDFTGRRWFYQELSEGRQDLQVITQNWPAGTYILQWISLGEAPQKQYLVKL